MRSRAGILALSTLAGAAFGVMEAAVWLKMLGGYQLLRERTIMLLGSGEPVLSVGLLAAILVVTAYLLVTRIYRVTAPHRALLMGLVSLVLGSAAYFVFATAIRPLSFGSLPSLLLLAGGCSLATSLAHWLVLQPTPLRRLSAARSGLLAFAAWIIAAAAIRITASPDALPGIGGFDVFSAVTQPSAHRVEPSALASALAGAALGLLVAVAWSWLTGGGSSRFLITAVVTGGVFSGALCTNHLVQLASIVGSGYSVSSAFASAVYGGAALGALTSLFLLALGSSRSARYSLLPLVVYLIWGGVYLGRVHAGSDLYLAAAATHAYRTNVYMHYSSDGGWRRTSDTRSDDIKLLMYNRLIQGYPQSIYRPEAMLGRAVSLYNTWDFDGASETLCRLHHDYPGSRAASWMLLYMSLLAAGKPAEAAHIAQGGDAIFHSWLLHQGARLAALPFEDLGLRVRATGLYSHYLDYLQEEYQGKWVSAAVRNTGKTISMLQRTLDAGKPKTAEVRGVVEAPSKASGIRVALVQPQLDTASLEDSRQFTGPRTLPLWHGRSGVTNETGRFTIRNVPYGTYEIVVGFDAASAPEGCVLAPVASPLQVSSPVVSLRPIRFVRKVDLLTPKDGAILTSTPVLRWRNLTGAASYSVSIIATRTSYPTDDGTGTSYTCWSRSGIKAAAAEVTQAGFDASPTSEEHDAGRLIPGKTYMWVVYARDAGRRIISSSEHYRLDHESTFTIAASSGSPVHGKSTKEEVVR